MIQTGKLDLTANRWSPFVYAIDFVGYDFSAATFSAQVRNYRDAPGDALVDLANAASTAEGVSVSVTTTDGVPTSTVQLRINETTLEGLRYSAPRGADLELQWALHITSTGMGKVRWLEGQFILKAGAAQ